MLKCLVFFLSNSIWSPIISAIVSIIIGIISGLLTARKAKMDFYSSTVSKERVNWINNTREITSKLIAFCSMHTEDDLCNDDLYKFEELRSALLLRLTPKEIIEEKKKYLETDGKLINILENEYSVIRDKRFEIRSIVTIICKNEWSRIKAEAGGNKDIENRIRKYDNSLNNK